MALVVDLLEQGQVFEVKWDSDGLGLEVDDELSPSLLEALVG